MPGKSILVEETAHGWGVALGPSGRFMRVRIPPGTSIGDEIRPISARTWQRPALAAAAVVALFFASLALLLPKTHSGSYALITLRFAPAIQPTSLIRIQDEQQIQMTLALDRQGMVAAVQPQAPTTQKLLGMRVEQAIHHAVGQYEVIIGGDVEVRPRRHSPDRETANIEARIRTALPSCEPPIEVEIGPPVEDGEEIAPPWEKHERHKPKDPPSEVGKLKKVKDCWVQIK